MGSNSRTTSAERIEVQANKVHHAGLRAVIGYRITTPTNIMNIETDKMDMESRTEFIYYKKKSIQTMK